MRGGLRRRDRVRGTGRERLVPSTGRDDRHVRRDRPDALRVGCAAGMGIELTDQRRRGRGRSRLQRPPGGRRRPRPDRSRRWHGSAPPTRWGSMSRSSPGEPTVSSSPRASAGWRRSSWRSTSRRGSRRAMGDERGRRPVFLAAAPVGDDIVIALNSAARPPELVVVSGHDPRTIVSTSNDGTDVVRSSVASRTVLSWTAPDGLEIQAFLTLPHGDGPFPLYPRVHGGPVWAFADSWPGPSRGSSCRGGSRCSSPTRAARGAADGSSPRRSSGTWAEPTRRVYLAGIDHVLEMGIADPGKIGVSVAPVGSLAALLPCLDQRFAAGVAFRPSPIGIPSGSTATSERGCGTHGRTRRTAGREVRERSPSDVRAQSNADAPHRGAARPRDPELAATELSRALRERDVPAELVLYPLEGRHSRDPRHPRSGDPNGRVVRALHAAGAGGSIGLTHDHA